MLADRDHVDGSDGAGLIDNGVDIAGEGIRQPFEDKRQLVVSTGLAHARYQCLLVLLDLGAASGRYQARAVTASPPARLILSTP